jgi:hypothetical protein
LHAATVAAENDRKKRGEARIPGPRTPLTLAEPWAGVDRHAARHEIVAARTRPQPFG